MGWSQAKLRVEDDGLFCPEVGPWAEEKYRLVALYDELFSTGMKNKWGKRVYIDLYAGAGYSRIQGTSMILKSSPILALTVHQPFDNYIFCEKDDEALDALKKRTAGIAPRAHVDFVAGDCHAQIDTICSLIPKASTVARIPFPTNLFCGDYDSHYGVVRHEDGTVMQEVTFEGSTVPDRLKLLKPDKP
jgi:hypothetical protein